MNASITEIFASRAFGTIGAAVLSSMICVIVKISSRRNKSKILNEFSVGLDMIVTGLFLMVAMSTDHFAIVNRPPMDEAAQQGLNVAFATSQWELMSFVAVLLATMLLIRLKGWKTKKDLHRFWGVILPDVIGLLSMWYVFNRY